MASRARKLLQSILHQKSHLPDHQELKGEMFSCSKEGFRTYQSVQQVPRAMESCVEPVQSYSILAVLGCESICTVKQRLLDNSLVSRRAAKKSLLSKTNI
ncbi:hypothetical protein DPX16_19495 [Anabarilius grahami]|uniref:Uncharacterized protein n=1 Tax=Anabarilius grahami TaxID=495550 RepID=A0A3N0Y8H1_ANAGA|nr:hypothetical protein DPX16_19495 [Anabarilius grahami]